MVIRSGSTPAYHCPRAVSGTPSYKPSSPGCGGSASSSTNTATLSISAASSRGMLSSASPTSVSNSSRPITSTVPLSRAIVPAGLHPAPVTGKILARIWGPATFVAGPQWELSPLDPRADQWAADRQPQRPADANGDERGGGVPGDQGGQHTDVAADLDDRGV